MKTLWRPRTEAKLDNIWPFPLPVAWLAHETIPTNFPHRLLSPFKRWQRAMARRWIKAIKEREWQRSLARQARREQAQRLAQWEACADEGVWLEFGHFDIDGQRFGALYRDGELVCLLPHVERL